MHASPKPILAAIVGAGGRVGRLLIETCEASDRWQSPVVVERDSNALPPGSEVIIDFSSPNGLMRALDMAVAAGVPIVSGTTGLDEQAEQALTAAATSVAVLHATNTSLGVALLNRLVADAAGVLDDDFDVELVEAHHRHKRDAPSGTAVTLLDRILKARGQTSDDLQHGRVGDGIRSAGSVGVHSLRLGDVVGRHEVSFAGTGEIVSLRHEATDRRTFARGALQAAAWLIGRPAGRYTMDDVLADRLER